jgi:hypothetical protein
MDGGNLRHPCPSHAACIHSERGGFYRAELGLRRGAFARRTCDVTRGRRKRDGKAGMRDPPGGDTKRDR